MANGSTNDWTLNITGRLNNGHKYQSQFRPKLLFKEEESILGIFYAKWQKSKSCIDCLLSSDAGERGGWEGDMGNQALYWPCIKICLTNYKFKILHQKRLRNYFLKIAANKNDDVNLREIFNIIKIRLWKVSDGTFRRLY